MKIKDLVGDLTYKEIKDRRWARCRIWKKGKKITFPDYIISDRGEVMRITDYASTYPGKTSKGTENSRGYFVVVPFRKGVGVTINLHRLVWESFNGRIPSKLEINHKDGIKANNNLDNFELLTRKKNMEHACRLGLHIPFLKGKYGVKNINAKLDNEKILEIRKMYATGNYTQKKMADIFGVTQTAIGKIVRRVLWTHI